VIEVKTQETARTLGDLSKVSELVNAQDGWQFVLVFTNPREPALTTELGSVAKVRELVSKSQAIGKHDAAHTEASFLFAWAALETSLRLLQDERKGGKQPTTPWTQIRDATIAGYLDRKDAQTLERLSKVRNSLLHAGSEAPPTSQDIDLLVRIILENIRSSEGN
jgi:hypothetical protein